MVTSGATWRWGQHAVAELLVGGHGRLQHGGAHRQGVNWLVSLAGGKQGGVAMGLGA